MLGQRYGIDNRLHTLRVLDNLCSWTFHNSYGRVGGTFQEMLARDQILLLIADLPKSIPITGPLTFLSASSAYLRTNEDPKGVRKRFADRVAEDVARGSCLRS